jgi:hypothetical protein
MKKLRWLILIGLVLSLVLVACGGGDADETTDEPVATEEAMEEEPTTEETTTEETTTEETTTEEVMTEGSIWVLLPDSASSARWETGWRRAEGDMLSARRASTRTHRQVGADSRVSARVRPMRIEFDP